MSAPDATSPLNDAEFQYLAGQGRPNFPGLLAEYESESERAAQWPGARLDVPYGPHPRQRFDLFPALHARATLLYFHAGYWQSRDKSTFRFIGPALAARGLNVAVLNYPLCPEVRVREIIDATHAAVVPVHESAGEGVPLILAGHSAGAHIAAELGLSTRPACGIGIGGVLAISGVFDLVPLCGTSLNTRLRLDRREARLASPLYRVTAGAPPAVFAVGAAETRAFHEQNLRMQRAWTAHGNRAEHFVIAGADHFSILRSLTSTQGLLHAALSTLA